MVGVKPQGACASVVDSVPQGWSTVNVRKNESIEVSSPPTTRFAQYSEQGMGCVCQGADKRTDRALMKKFGVIVFPQVPPRHAKCTATPSEWCMKSFILGQTPSRQGDTNTCGKGQRVERSGGQGRTKKRRRGRGEWLRLVLQKRP